MNIINVKTAASTNDLLKELAGQQILEEGTAVVTHAQTAGKGQRGNTWESEPGKNIACSLLLYPAFLPVKQFFLLSEAVALGVKEALDVYAEGFVIKWPNDIYFREQKIAGILIENEIIGQQFAQAIVGIGLNVNQTVFLSDAPNPVSLKQITGKTQNVNQLSEKLLKAVLFRYEQLKSGDTAHIVRAYHEALYRKSGFHAYKDKQGRFSARIEKITDDGLLHLITDKNEKRSYAFKEVKMERG
jgi:BirA family biotin operon repressor/biotin-[acetyl-CoA-carboxylase] ligase